MGLKHGAVVLVVPASPADRVERFRLVECHCALELGRANLRVALRGLDAHVTETRAQLLTDRRSGYLVAAFEDHLQALQIRHIYCAPHYPQTNGKLERFHETLEARLNLLVYTSPEVIRTAMADFIRVYNHERYHEGIGNVTPADVYDGRRDATLRRWAAQKSRTLARRVRYNRAAAMQGARGELTGDLSVQRTLTESQRC
jgi:hypothetical protein